MSKSWPLPYTRHINQGGVGELMTLGLLSFHTGADRIDGGIFIEHRSSESEFNEVLVHSEHEVLGVICLHHTAQAIAFHICVDGLGGDWQVIMRDVLEEQVVGDMAISDVMVEVINPEVEL
jgi:hypothetical protein